ncbi:MAG TPA: proline--tRNA ligase [Cyanobacteria bacterium UBA8530]|nr:proline--tRNA ligase [Cyanobacteria bacterium UBA8530]
MRMSHLLAPTLREVPAEAEIISHQLLMRAGFIRRVSPGVYTYLPLMWRVLKKVEEIVRQEMDRAGAQELMMPILLPADLWMASGRWFVYGKEMFRLKNRHDRDELLGPTHEELITDIAKNEIRSYRQLPINLYQIQNKFRDEIRPRFGLLRGREFIMKDSYSFHSDEKSLEETYEVMCRAYTRIFERCGLSTRMVDSDVGAIGGSSAHEFMVVVETDAGENALLYCDSCQYAANVERAESRIEIVPGAFEEQEPLEKIPTPNMKTIDDLSAFLKVLPNRIVKTLIYQAEGFGEKMEEKKFVAVLIRGDVPVNEVKLKNTLACYELRLATDEEISALGTISGFVGPIGLKLRVLADESVREMKNFVLGPNEKDQHLVHANWGRDYEPKEWVDVRQSQVGEQCSRCGGELKQARGIEVGNTFKLGTKYSSKMGATFTDVDGTEKPFVMGCYGIGVSRTAQAAVEACHDKNGIVWPVPIAPYHLVVVPVNVGDPVQKEAAESLYRQAQEAGIEVILDDRDERPGVKFKDADLIGFPLRITVGKTITEGNVELKERQGGEVILVPLNEAIEKAKSMLGIR